MKIKPAKKFYPNDLAKSNKNYEIEEKLGKLLGFDERN